MKKTAVTRETSPRAAQEMLQQYNVLDDGAVGKVTEIIGRFLVCPYTKVGYVQCQTRMDIITKKHGRTMRIEVKTACGVLVYGTSAQSMDEVEMDDIMPRADYVLYAPEIDVRRPLDVQLYVFSRSDFIDFLQNCGLIRLRRATSGQTDVAIQTFKTSKKKSDMVWDTCLTHYNLRTWLQSF